MSQSQNQSIHSRIVHSVLVAGLAWFLAHPCSCSPSPSDTGLILLEFADAELIRWGDRTFDVPSLISRECRHSALAQAVRDYMEQGRVPQTVPRCIVHVPHADTVPAKSLLAMALCCGQQGIEDVEVAGIPLHLPIGSGPTLEEQSALRERAERFPPLLIHTEADLAALAEREEQMKDQPIGVRADPETPLSLLLATVEALRSCGAQVRLGLPYGRNSTQDAPVVIEVAPRNQGLYVATPPKVIRERRPAPSRRGQ